MDGHLSVEFLDLAALRSVEQFNGPPCVLSTPLSSQRMFAT